MSKNNFPLPEFVIVLTQVYACGGAGTNLGLKIDNQGVFNVGYVDTSQSNVVAGLDASRCHFLEGVDGSGKNRREHYNAIVKDVGRVLDQFEPLAFNIVLFSAAGGSGSVIGPLVLKELLAAGHTAMAVVIGSDDSAITVTNTINTLKSLESISQMTQQPVVMCFAKNSQGVTRGVIDDDVLFTLEALRVLTSQDNLELDKQDLTNWLQFQKVSPVSPQLAFMNVFDNRQGANTVVEPIAIASLYRDASKESPFGNPYYHTVGFPRSGEMTLGEQLHFVINIADVEETLKGLLERQVVLNKTYSGYRQRKTAVDVDDNLTNDGLIL